MTPRFRALSVWIAAVALFAAGLAQAQTAQTGLAQPKPAQAKPAEEKPAAAQEAAVLGSEREKVSYAIGLDVGRSIAAVGPDLDFAAFERAVRNAFAGGKPLLSDEESQTVGTALMQRIGERTGRPAPGTAPGAKAPAVAKDKVGFLVGTDVGRSLAPIQKEIDMPVFLQSLRTVFAEAKPLLGDDEARTVLETFSKRLKADEDARIAEQAKKNAEAGAAFLAKNKSAKGVISTGSGLQYMVLRQGAGPRPKATDRVRVNYRGTLLDGTEFDSSYSRGQAAEFALNQVIAGWTEGVALMPVGAKFRFWIPAGIAYGERGSPSIPPNSTLVFDVELLDVL